MKKIPYLIILASLVVSAVLAVTACGPKEATPAPAPAPAPAPSPAPSPAPQPQPAPGTAEVEIANGKFNPETITVPVGTKVIWVNRDDVRHWVTSDSGIPDTASIPLGARMSFTFEKPGTYPYYDLTYKDQKGTVIVQ